MDFEVIKDLVVPRFGYNVYAFVVASLVLAIVVFKGFSYLRDRKDKNLSITNHQIDILKKQYNDDQQHLDEFQKKQINDQLQKLYAQVSKVPNKQSSYELKTNSPFFSSALKMFIELCIAMVIFFVVYFVFGDVFKRFEIGTSSIAAENEWIGITVCIVALITDISSLVHILKNK